MRTILGRTSESQSEDEDNTRIATLLSKLLHHTKKSYQDDLKLDIHKRSVPRKLARARPKSDENWCGREFGNSTSLKINLELLDRKC
ncbi:hypothetical protein AVEN_174051-1 [Araneus ventricosus]|uniref:Uncharacterized protein n=1 Tax=Araneus ventricosus TaxID=182803 RepID=A0A4Y2C286_ARAVE|nr:hypothetical protein AVEN_174051-1 [Araneus ventricosus]